MEEDLIYVMCSICNNIKDTKIFSNEICDTRFIL